MSVEHHVGAKPLPLPKDVVTKAFFDGPHNCYRYSLEWRKAPGFVPELRPGVVMFLMMNPSVADEKSSDRTVSRCWQFARSWGFEFMFIGNSAAYRATDQARLAEIEDPVGPNNFDTLNAMATLSELIIVAYGRPKVAAARRYGPDAARMLLSFGHKLHVLALGRDGCPKHPLYIRGDTEPQPWAGPKADSFT